VSTLAEAAELAALAFVADLDVPVLDAADQHHLARVLRIRPGQTIAVADGRGSWRQVRFGPTLELDGPVVEEPPPGPEIGVAFALVKGDRPELVVQKLTELGVDVIVPFVAGRSVVQWDGERASRHVGRLQKVAREAAMQCRRPRLPTVEPVRSFADVAARSCAALATLGGQVVTESTRIVLVGPEGGWSEEELAAPLPRVGLAPYVLRSETAAITAGALLAAARRRSV
jgi:16S rRNA (uracil1498-N3)-methyltransferase